VKLTANVANEFPESGKTGNIQKHRDDLMPEDPMPCVFCVNEDAPEPKTLHPVAGRIEAPICHG